MALSLERVCCLDIEASALDHDSYPIEVGVVACSTHARSSWLIKPTEDWRKAGVWSAKSARIHGIKKRELDRDGLPVCQVARELAAWCDGMRVLCDGGDYDRYWLRRLFDAAGMEAPFVVGGYHAFARDLAFSAGRRVDIAIAGAEMEALLRFPVRHRAADDAARLAETLRQLAGLS